MKPKKGKEGEKNVHNEWGRWKTNIDVANVNPNILAIMLNVNGVYILLKRYIRLGFIRSPTLCCLGDIHLECKEVK